MKKGMETPLKSPGRDHAARPAAILSPTARAAALRAAQPPCGEPLAAAKSHENH